jgi:hypothetical protein
VIWFYCVGEFNNNDDYGFSRGFFGQDDDGHDVPDFVSRCQKGVTMKGASTKSEFLQSVYGKKECVNFFTMQARCVNLGVQYIIDKAMFVHVNPTETYLRANPVPKAEQLLQLSFTQFFKGLSKKQQAEFATLIGMISEKIHEEALPLEATRVYSSRSAIPTTTNEFRCIYLHAPHSIVHNLPHPLVEQLEEFHTNTPIPCILSDLMGFNTSFQGCWNYETGETSEVSCVFDTRRGISMLIHLAMLRGLEPTFSPAATLWSDDMDPNNKKITISQYGFRQ